MLIKKKINVIKNNIKALKNYNSRKIFIDNLPTYFWIEPTNKCNLRCIMCPNGTGKIIIKKGYMNYNFYKKIIDEIRDHVSAVTLAVNGESLLHPMFTDMAKYASKNDIKTILNTNATVLSIKKAKDLLDCGIRTISFAFDGFNKEMYEKNRVGAIYEETLENIINFLKLKKKNRKKSPYTVLSILMLDPEKKSRKEREIFLKKFELLINEIRLREVSTWGKTFKGTKSFSFRQNTNNYLPCSRLWSTGVIAYNGDVLPCVYNANHEYTLGNIHETPFKEIWNGEKMLTLRKSMVDGDYLSISPVCENCIVLGTPPIIKIPSGIRLTLSDSITNLIGYRFERWGLALANKIRKGEFSSRTILR